MTIRLGVLAASRIAVAAVVEPIDRVDGIDVVAVAARDADRARDAATAWGAERAHRSYQALIDDADVDAVYIATPASLHRRWAVAALEAGKHVLCEKPLAANADDARRVAAAAARSDRVAMEAYHWRYHPMIEQLRALLDSGRLGRIDRIDAAFDVPDGAIPRSDIRWNLTLGGGATMDLGCYTVQWVRFAAGSDPDVIAARAECPIDGVDGALEADLRWPSGVEGRIRSSMISTSSERQAWLRVRGALGTLIVTNALAPQYGGAVIVVDGVDGVTTHGVSGASTYVHQLAAFRDAIRDGAEFPTTIDDGVRTMEIIDACYRSAGLEPRPAVDDVDR